MPDASALPTSPGTELNQLRDIHLPDPIGWWPPAPGWYLLGAFICLILFTLVFFIIRHRRNGRSKREALRVLDAYQQDYLKHRNAPISAARISELLKQVALMYYPRKQVASLQGTAWIDFLNQTGEHIDFKPVSTLLIECPYQPNKPYDLLPLFLLAETWIKQRRGRCLN